MSSGPSKTRQRPGVATRCRQAPGCRQRGVGLIDAMLALALLVLSLTAFASTMTDTLVAMSVSRVHQSVESRASEIGELLQSNRQRAGAGALNVAFDTSDPSSGPLGEWRRRVANTMPGGDARIDCDTRSCLVQMRWRDVVDGSSTTRLYQMKTPL